MAEQDDDSAEELFIGENERQRGIQDIRSRTTLADVTTEYQGQSSRNLASLRHKTDEENRVQHLLDLYTSDLTAKPNYRARGKHPYRKVVLEAESFKKIKISKIRIKYGREELLRIGMGVQARHLKRMENMLRIAQHLSCQGTGKLPDEPKAPCFTAEQPGCSNPVPMGLNREYKGPAFGNQDAIYRNRPKDPQLFGMLHSAETASSSLATKPTCNRKMETRVRIKYTRETLASIGMRVQSIIAKNTAKNIQTIWSMLKMME